MRTKEQEQRDRQIGKEYEEKILKAWNKNFFLFNWVTDIEKDVQGIDLIGIIENEIISEKEQENLGIKNLTNNLFYSVVFFDVKYRTKIYYYQKKTEYGVNILPIEISKRKVDKKGWGNDLTLKTHYIIYTIKDYCCYIINSLALRSFINGKEEQFPVVFTDEKKKCIGVPVELLMNKGIICYIQVRGKAKYSINENVSKHIEGSSKNIKIRG